jgi:hypothetical protein
MPNVVSAAIHGAPDVVVPRPKISVGATVVFARTVEPAVLAVACADDVIKATAAAATGAAAANTPTHVRCFLV